VLDGDPDLNPQKGGTAPQFSAHVHCGQMAGWIKMPLGTEVGLSPGHIVIDGDQAPLQKKGQSPPIFGPCLLWPNGWMHQDTTWYGGRLWPSPHYVRWGPSSTPSKGHSPPFSSHVCCGQMAGWIKMPLGTKVGLGPGHIVLPPRGAQPPPLIFGSCLLWPNGCPSQLL